MGAASGSCTVLDQQATGLEKVHFHSNPKERQSQRTLTLLHDCTEAEIGEVCVNILKPVFFPVPYGHEVENMQTEI